MSSLILVSQSADERTRMLMALKHDKQYVIRQNIIRFSLVVYQGYCLINEWQDLKPPGNKTVTRLYIAYLYELLRIVVGNLKNTHATHRMVIWKSQVQWSATIK